MGKPVIVQHGKLQMVKSRPEFETINK